MQKIRDFREQALSDPERFWRTQASLIHWNKPFTRAINTDAPPFVSYFEGGYTNLCYNAVDRHLEDRADQAALIYVSGETGTDQTFSFADLHREVMRCAALLESKGVHKGDRVLLYLPMIPEAVFVMLACVRIGAVHSVVFGGFASQALADRIDDLRPTLIVAADAGLRGGRVINYKHLLDTALGAVSHRVDTVLLVNRGLLDDLPVAPDRDQDYQEALHAIPEQQVPAVWLESSAPSYILYTSGTTGAPKGVQRDTGGYSVALAASMRHIYDGRAGETMFSTSDIGWVVGHSYIVYGPLLAGMATILYEGTPLFPDPGIWWRTISKYKPAILFSSPTGIRLFKTEDPKHISDNDTSSLRHVFLAGEPLDEATAKWASQVLGQQVKDHFWQTETGWSIICPLPGIEEHPLKWGSPSFAAYGYDVQIIDEATGQSVSHGDKGMLAIRWPLPPGAMTTIWGDDERFEKTYFRTYSHSDGDEVFYLTFDFAVCDDEGYHYLLGRSDDVINVAGHRLGTREIEATLCELSDVAEAAVVGVSHEVKGQQPLAFLVTRTSTFETESALKHVRQSLGAIACPGAIYVVSALPKTRSGKILRRVLRSIAEGEDPGELPTIEDASIIDRVREELAAR
ncbi:MAG: propionate--CoA ligase [Pseudomonadota bacterium]